MPDTITPFTLAIPQPALDDLHTRLTLTRWPDAQTAPGWTQGVPLDRAQSLIAYWRDSYDWRRCESMLNAFGQFKTTIDGLEIHFLHIRSKHPKALPLIITHGWPGSVIEFHKIIGPLTDPVAHGGRAEDAFDVIAPSLPGYGFSGHPTDPGWGIERIATAWAILMSRLGYHYYVAQGGDWGSAVTTTMARQRPPGLAAIHLNMVSVRPKLAGATPTATEQAALDARKHYQQHESSYSAQQTTRPQTLGYGLADSPAGQALWIYEKFQSWTDCHGDPENVLTRDEILDDIMLYWLPNCATSSARLYWESYGNFVNNTPVNLPVGCSLYPKEINRPPRHWAEAIFSNIIHWNELPRGGHFPAFEQPEIFVGELRDCFRRLR
jgi:pimeloyl-ACP methyl ester carboxylesterase